MKKITELEVKWIMVVASVGGMSKKALAERYNYKYMDVINVLRGNSFSNISGILHHSITEEEIITVSRLLQCEHPYRDIASYAGIEDNKVRNIMGYLQFEGVI